MATSKQEQLYNEIIEYYDFADKLIQIVENSKDELAEQQFEIIEEAITRFEKCADFLEIALIDHLIITRNGFFSFSNEGKLS